MWILYAIGSAVTAALVAVFGKIGLKDADPTLATILRGVVMALFLVIAGAALRKFSAVSFSSIDGKAWFFILLSALAGAASWLLYFLALKDGPASAVAVIDKLSVVLVVIIAALFLGETFTLRTAAGIVLTVVGTLFILFP